MITYISICSGIEAATVAWHPIGFEPIFFAENDSFPSALLQHHYPEVPNLGDITNFKAWSDRERIRPSILVGGTPCQSFSVAGLRKGLDDPRGNLALTYLAIAERYRPRWLVWENVPGVLSSVSHAAPDPSPPADDVDEGAERVVEDEYDADEVHSFACFLAGLRELGYGFAYRTLDAQYFGLAQRRARVFVVGYLGDWRRAAGVLLEPSCLRGDPPPSREAGEGIASTVGTCAAQGSDDLINPGGLHICSSTGERFHCLNAGAMGRIDYESETMVYQDISGALRASAGAARQSDEGVFDQPLILAFSSKDHGADASAAVAPTIRAAGHDSSHANAGAPPAVAFNWQESQNFVAGETANPLRREQTEDMHSGMHIRRLTPRECERLQGFPDDYTLIPGYGADGPRYKALGNSMAVPIMRWIGERIKLMEEVLEELKK